MAVPFLELFEPVVFFDRINRIDRIKIREYRDFQFEYSCRSRKILFKNVR